MRRQPTGIERLNQMDEDSFRASLSRCCGSSRWVSEMARRRPFSDVLALFSGADESWWCLAPDDWKEAFGHHPKVGERESLRRRFTSTRSWSEREQSGVLSATEQTLNALVEGNAAYERKFGHIFIVYATGKTADEMLFLLNQRLPNDPEVELEIASEEQRKIMRLRLGNLIEEGA
jgi:2-oxo-4-hydroxy-4-carboxy-5-ureidoimidazoline decarboxylase